ncbi:hypothetical protein [Methyloglobulus sp.]|uniref:hypothetical protein n=1 Tax=Methyloglobulus sp. TaxID=2518622 RepID=UPI003988F1A2
MKKMYKTPLAAAMGAALISTFAPTPANAEANPFAMTELSSGYMQLAEMKCGASMGMGDMAKPKAAEGACAGNKAAAATKKVEGACGEGKCGAMMKDGKMKAGMEKVCGAMMKGKEGACGMAKDKPAEGKCGAACAEGMKNCEAAKTTEGACGDKMKGCGEGMKGCTEMMKGKDSACGANKKPAAPAPAK